MQGDAIHLRRANQADIEQIADLRWRLKKEDDHRSTEEERKAFIAAFVDWCRTSGKQSATTHHVAELNSGLIAIMSTITVDKIAAPDELNGRFGYLTNCYVLPQYRNREVGWRLLAEVRRWAEESGLEFLVVWPSERAFPFYERAGFVRNADPLVLALR